jgi:predicted anti-sigma-YlaC factor YlaD
MKGKPMSHQPFEKWIFSDDSLDHEQQNSLEKHLEECQACQSLADAMMTVNSVISASDSPAPKPGFTQRWHNRLSLHRQHQQKQRTWLLTMGIFVLANIILLSLIFLDLTTINWSYELSRIIVNLSLIASQSRQVWRAVYNIANAFPLIIPMSILSAVGLFLAAVVLMTIWFRSIKKLIQTN